MTAPAFPLSQLGRPTVDYTLKPADLRVRTDTYSGLAQSYNASNSGLTTISVKWEWGAAQYAIFQAWFRDECKDGSIEFTINDLYLNNSLATITARFTEPPKASYSAWMHYSVSATLETRTNDYVTEATLDAALSAGPITANPTWPTALFGRPSSDGASEEAQSSSLRGNTSGYARPAMRRKSPVTVTNMPIKWNMSQANKILFDAWYHYKLVDGAGWFWLFTDFHGELNYMIKVRFVESISLKYSSVDWWEISGTVETVEYNYLPLADCPTLVAPTNIDTLLPIITDQPDDVSAVTGTTVTLSVTATTETGTLSYQWYFGTVALVGETSASYSFTLSDTTDGGYHVVVSNDVGHVTSRTAEVIIAGIVSQFSSLVSGRDICQASNGNFYVVSTSGVYEVLQDGTYSLISTTATGDGICQKSDGYLYVSGNVTWKLDTSGNTVQYSLRGGSRICEGYNGLLYVTGFNTNSYTSAIWSINSDGTYQRFASVGYYPYTSFEGICYDGTNFYVKNANNSLLCVISNSGSLVTSKLVQVGGYSIINSSDGFLYVLASQGQYPLRRVTKAGVVTDFSTVAGRGICEASDHNFYVVDYANGIFKVTH